MCTLTTQFGIKWTSISLAGRVAYVHNRFVIAYSPRDRRYHLCHNGKSLLSNKSIADCLDLSSETILDAYSNMIVASWDDDSLEVIEEEPITERYPANYIPDWAEAAA